MANLRQTTKDPKQSDVSLQSELDQLRYVQSVYELAIHSAGIGIFYYDVDKYGIDRFEANDIYAELLGFQPDDNGLYKLRDFESSLMETEDKLADQISIRQSLSSLLQGDVEGTSEELLKLRNLSTGSIKYFISSSRIDERYEDGRPKRFGGSIIDITERVVREKNQMRFAFTDELTRLANNRKLIDDMPQREDGIGLFFDLDHFKRINDTYGHLVGDDLLRLYAKALLFASSKHDSVYPYRLHGDEFFVFCEGKDAAFARLYQEDIRHHVGVLSKELDHDIDLDASMGYSRYKKGMDVDDFIKEADYAMYETKIAKKQQEKT